MRHWGLLNILYIASLIKINGLGIVKVDLSYLEEITSGDKDVMLEMIGLFIRDIPKQVEAIAGFAASRDLKGLAAESHRLKPTLQYAGLTQMHEYNLKLETIGKSGEYSEEIPDLVDKLEAELKAMLPELVAAQERFK